MKDATLVALVLDRSGSIGGCLNIMQSALDEFIEKQKAEPGECELALFQFDDQYEKVFHKPIKEVTKHVIVPRNMTALHDAIGKTITDIGETLSMRPESERPNKVVVCIITDGLENASREFSQVQVAEMVKHQIDNYQWNFVFLGANQNAVLTAKQYNIAPGSALSYAPSAFDPAAGSLSNYVSTVRSCASGEAAQATSFTDDDRKKALGNK